MLRSEPMTMCNMYLAPEAAFNTMQTLGDMCCVEFLDNNEDVQPFQRNYVAEMCRCAEMERKLNYIYREMERDDILIPRVHHPPDAIAPKDMMTLEITLEQKEQEILELTNNQTKMMKNYLELTEMYYVLKYTEPIIGASEILRGNKFNQGDGPLGSGSLFVYTGVVMRARCFTFETMLWRVSRGNIHFSHASRDKILRDPLTGRQLRKVAFVVVAQGHQLSHHVEKICTGFKVNLYPCPQTSEERVEMIKKLDVRLADIEQVLKKTSFHRKKALLTVAHHWQGWMCQVKKSKAIYHHLNLFDLDVSKECLIGKCWVPNIDLQPVQDVLQQVITQPTLTGTAAHSFLTETKTRLTPPTYFLTNKFTQGFQNLIDAYGDAAYGEINPGLYTIITFPFLFAVMFGDVGHAIIMTLFASWMIRNEKKFEEEGSDSEIWHIFFSGRYVILLMGVFAFFTGFIYNDFFSKGFTLSAPCWYSTYTVAELATDQKMLALNAFKENGKLGSHENYWFGFSPAWLVAKNKMVFQNSLKMKMSVIIGVLHMVFGLVLSLVNHIHHKEKYAIFFEFIPQLMFLSCLFLYLVFMIYFKWFKFSMYSEDVKSGVGCAPLLLIYFIDMVLMSKSKPLGEDCDIYMYEGQRVVQNIMMLGCVSCVPLLLLGTPLYCRKRNKEMHRTLKLELAEVRKKTLEKYPKGRGDRGMIQTPEELEIIAELDRYPLYGDMQIVQGVHTIEFCLSTISHTASYLRLWALSLAHQQLSEMLWEMVMGRIGLHDHRAFAFLKLFPVFAIWATFTLSIMVVMEALSAFLHTLRLHWVEFMSKFFIGGGHRFRPFCFRIMLEIKTPDDTTTGICTAHAKASAKLQDQRQKKFAKMKKY